MIFILEGPDGAGKTTLAEALRLRYPHKGMVHVVKHGPYKGISSQDLCKIYFRGMAPALTFDDTVIMDRSWISEPIYGEVYRNGENRVDLPRRRMLERVALSRGGVVIHCQPEFDVCAETFEKRTEEEYLDDINQLEQVYNEYEQLQLFTDLPTIHYDYTRDTVDELLKKVDAVSTPNGAAGGGCFKQGNILMLCDRGPRANLRDSAVVVPFINFLDNDGPSRMLAEALNSEGISERDVYWINTQTYQGVPTDPSFIKKLKPSKIFALGNNAYAWAINNNVKAIKLPPPLHHLQNYSNQPYLIMESDYGNSNTTQ